jgi:H(+)-translocating pyrophosphatase
MALISVFIVLCCAAGLVTACVYTVHTRRVQVVPSLDMDFDVDHEFAPKAKPNKHDSMSEHDDLEHNKIQVDSENLPEDIDVRSDENLANSPRPQGVIQHSVQEIAEAIKEGAISFLLREYFYMAVFMVIFGALLLVFLGIAQGFGYAGFTILAYILGALTSIASGYIGMRIAVFANARTALSAIEGYGPAFSVAFKAGAVMGFGLVSLGILVLLITIWVFSSYYGNAFVDQAETERLYEAIAGYGLGGSTIALFGRVGGGIYTKAADVGADLVGKVEKNIPEDDPRNPAVIADNVGDNVGDIAGMGADLFGSLAESACAAMVISAQSSLFSSFTYMTFPLLITSSGILVCMFTLILGTGSKFIPKSKEQIEPALKRQLLLSTFIMTPVIFLISMVGLPSSFTSAGITIHNYGVSFCILCGLWAGLGIGYVTEYFTSHSYTPVQEVARACETGAATNIIYGLALGYKSNIVPVVLLMITIYVSFAIAGTYGISMAALGILSTLPIGLTIDAYGPISDNAGGIAEMANLGSEVRKCTDALDAAGNTTAAIGKGFAIGSAALVSLALYSAFVNTSGLDSVNLLQPLEFSGLLFGALLPYWFSAMTMKSVGKAALAMVQEVRRQFHERPGMIDGSQRPDYAQCVKISTDASLREMILPGALVLVTPIVTGFLFGTQALSGVLAGALVSGVQMAISSSNTGGAWDNAKVCILFVIQLSLINLLLFLTEIH